MGFNFKNVETSGTFTPVPEDRYTLRVDKAEVANSSTGNVMVRLQMSIQDNGDYKGRLVFDQLVFSDASLWRVKAALEAFESSLANGEDVEPSEVATSLMNSSASAWVTIKSNDKGKPSNVVKSYNTVESQKAVTSGLLV